ncbi:hypothetical protein [Cohnella sp. GCM10012308]
MELARDYIGRHYREVVTVDVLAGGAGMGRYYYMRAFKERFG